MPKGKIIVYYTMNLASTEEISMFHSYSNFAIGLVCEANNNEKLSVHDLLKINLDLFLMLKIMMEQIKNIQKIFKHMLVIIMIFIIKKIIN